MKPFLPPYLKRLKRGPAVILPKDAGAIITYAGITKHSEVLECGAGSGFLTLTLARVCKHVTAVERRQEFVEIIKHNLKTVDNVTIIHADCTTLSLNKRYDVIVCDVKDPVSVLKHVTQFAKPGATVVCYIPNIDVVHNVYQQLNTLQLTHVRTITIEEREWLIRERGVRPQNWSLTHTAFLMFLKKE
jgi:tRNA (adenine57-N1/adenine58-N1)-methyltransferase